MNNPISFRLTDECLEIIGRLEKALGIKRSAIIELAVRELAKKNKIS